MRNEMNETALSTIPSLHSIERRGGDLIEAWHAALDVEAGQSASATADTYIQKERIHLCSIGCLL
jgi:hypothetical protein